MDWGYLSVRKLLIAIAWVGLGLFCVYKFIDWRVQTAYDQLNPAKSAKP